MNYKNLVGDICSNRLHLRPQISFLCLFQGQIFTTCNCLPTNIAYSTLIQYPYCFKSSLRIIMSSPKSECELKGGHPPAGKMSFPLLFKVNSSPYLL